MIEKWSKINITMFLDEELEAIYNDSELKEKKSFRLFQACLKRIPKPDGMNTKDFLNDIRKIEAGWKLFCKKHTQFNPEGFRNLMVMQCGDILSKPLLNYLHWD